MSKVLVISGGSKGIGRAAIDAFLAAGYRAVNLSRSRVQGKGILHISADLSNRDWPSGHGAQLQAAVKDAEQIAVVHNAALLAKDSVRDVDASALARILQLNVIAPAQLNQLLLPSMRPGSCILYVGSTLSEKAVPGSCSYVTSKHALVGLMRATCQDLAGSGIHTACVCPGFTDTEMLRAHVGKNKEILAALAGNVTFGRLIEPREIADTLLFCAQHPVINGAVLHANLGQMER